MDYQAFSSLKENMKSSIDSYKIDMLNDLNSETYTCQQVKEILDLMSIGSYRVDAFKILSTKLKTLKIKVSSCRLFRMILQVINRMLIKFITLSK